MWGTGDYKAVADKIAGAGETVVERAGIEPGMDVLDVACGTGNATIPAAQAGGAGDRPRLRRPTLLEIARERGADAMVEVDWIEGDAQALPFEDDSFDRVISCFGHMFAPDHERTAAEMRASAGPAGGSRSRCWTPEGKIGRMFRRIGELPAAPDGFQPPLLWGTEDHVRELLGDGVEFERHEVEWREARSRPTRTSWRKLRAADRTPASSSASAAASARGLTALPRGENEPTTARCASAASTSRRRRGWSRARPARARRSPRARGPAPSTTQVSGSSASATGTCVSSCRRSAKPRSSAPPPASRMPRRVRSAASSGGRVLERVLDRVDDLRHERLERLAHLRARDLRLARQAARRVAAADLGDRRRSRPARSRPPRA